jgi:hypothetical protein
MITKRPQIDISKLTLRDRHRKIPVSEAADIADMCEASWRKHFGHLIQKLTERCHRVDFIDAITLPPAEQED